MKTIILPISHSINHSPLRCALILIPLVLMCAALLPEARAVTPAPDGGYPGFNTAEGDGALQSLTSGTSNTAIGFDALFSNTTGSNNTTGNFNTTDGAHSLENNSTGSANTALGFGAGNNVTTAGNVICIGSGVVGANVSNSCFIGSVFGQTSSGGAAVFINSSGKLGTITSSRRFKEQIRPMAQSSEVLFALKPVIFRYKKEIEPQKIPQFGLVAEDVEAVDPDLVVRDEDG